MLPVCTSPSFPLRSFPESHYFRLTLRVPSQTFWSAQTSSQICLLRVTSLNSQSISIRTHPLGWTALKIPSSPFKMLQSSIELSFDFYDYVTAEWERGRGCGFARARDVAPWRRSVGYNLFLLRLLICMRLTCAFLFPTPNAVIIVCALPEWLSWPCRSSGSNWLDYSELVSLLSAWPCAAMELSSENCLSGKSNQHKWKL